MISCRFVVSSEAKAPQRSARSTSAWLQANSARYERGVDFSYASVTFESDTDLLPCVSRISWSFGRFTPMGVIGPASPVSMTTSTARAVTPVTRGLRYFGAQGIRSSNHCACSAIAWACAVFSGCT